MKWHWHCKITGRTPGALGVCTIVRWYEVLAETAEQARGLVIDAAYRDGGIEHVQVTSCQKEQEIA